MDARLNRYKTESRDRKLIQLDKREPVGYPLVGLKCTVGGSSKCPTPDPCTPGFRVCSFWPVIHLHAHRDGTEKSEIFKKKKKKVYEKSVQALKQGRNCTCKRARLGGFKNRTGDKTVKEFAWQGRYSLDQVTILLRKLAIS